MYIEIILFFELSSPFRLHYSSRLPWSCHRCLADSLNVITSFTRRMVAFVPLLSPPLSNYRLSFFSLPPFIPFVLRLLVLVIFILFDLHFTFSHHISKYHPHSRLKQVQNAQLRMGRLGRSWAYKLITNTTETAPSPRWEASTVRCSPTNTQKHSRERWINLRCGWAAVFQAPRVRCFCPC